MKLNNLLSSYYLKGGYWWIFTKFFQFLSSLGIMWIFANFASKELYGTYKYLLSFYTLLSIFALPGIDIVLVKEAAQGGESFLKKGAKEKLKWGLGGTFLSFLISGWYFFHDNYFLGILFIIIGFFLPFLNAFQLFSPFWQGKKRLDLQSKYSVIVILFSSLITATALFLTKNLVVVFIAQFAVTLTLRYLFYQITLQKISCRAQSNFTSAIKFGKHLSLLELFSVLSSQIDKLIIWQFLGPVGVAIYAFAQTPINKIKEFIPIFPLALPKLSEKKSIPKQLILKKFGQLFIFSFPLSVACFFFLPYFYKFFFPQYQSSIRYAQILSLSLVFLPFTLLGTSFFAREEIRKIYFTSVFSIILNFVLLITTIRLWGILGAVITALIVQFLSSLLVLFLFLRK